MALPVHAQEWMNRAEIDYIGPFVKAWAAFNAWYRHASGADSERAMLNFILTDANSNLRRRGLPLLSDGNATADAIRLKQAIGDLQTKLDEIHFEVTNKRQVRERVSLREVRFRSRQLNNEVISRHRIEYRVRRVQGGGGAIEISVTSIGTQQVKFYHTQQEYDPANVYMQPAFTTALNAHQQTTLRQFYDGCNPRPLTDLIQGDGPRLQAGSMTFNCSSEDMLSGLVETIYTMRNALLHGEVDPDRLVLACYEPAYRIVMSFLDCVK